MLIATALFVVGDTIIKLLGRELPLGQILLMRGLFSAPLIVWLAIRGNVITQLPYVMRHPRIQLRTLFEVGSTILFLWGLIRMPYSDAIAIQQFIPLAVMAGAAVFLGEPVGWRRWLAAFAGFIGVLIIVRPGAGTFNWPALFIIGCVACIAGRDLVTRRIGANLPSALVAMMSIVCVGLSGLLLLPFENWRLTSWWETLLIVVAGVSSTGGFYWVVEALRIGPTAAVMPFRYALIPYGVISGILVFGEWPDMTGVLGMAIVLGAGLYALHRERVRAREEDGRDGIGKPRV